MAEFRLFGPVEMWVGGRRIDVGQPRQRAVLAALLVDAGQVVTLPTLVDRVWGDAPPDTARRTLHSYVARVRKVLAQAGAMGDEPTRLARRDGGYTLDVELDRVDVHRFRGLVGQARDRACPDTRRVALLREALALWRAEPLAGLAGGWAQRTSATRAR
jgi:DNA-binding SARP family transcriptional activator